MDSDKKITVHERDIKKLKGRPTSYFKTIKTDGALEDAEKAVKKLKNKGSLYFETRNEATDKITVYKKSINSANYVVKVH